MRAVVLFAGLFFVALGCRPDYKTDSKGNCYKTYSSPVNRFQALRTCQRDGATLFPITSPADADAFTFISNTLGAMVWIGATCVTEEGTSCFTDEGTPLSYTAFGSGTPNAYGTCVLFQTYTKNWFSSPCSETVAPFVCKYTENPYTQHCEAGKWLFNGKCYWALAAQYPQTAENFCESQQGSMVSVHSIGENGFIHDIIHNSYGTTQDFYKVGLSRTTSANPFKWRDATPYDYNNFGLNIGDPCTQVSLNGKVVGSGKWFTGTCDIILPTACKKDATLAYVPPKVMQSQLCDGSYLEPDGTIVSPNYPSYYLVNDCSNYLIWDTKIYPRLYISFVELSLGPGDYVKIFTDLSASVPAFTFSSASAPGKVVSVTSGKLRFDYHGNNQNGGKYRWKAITSTTQISSSAGANTNMCGWADQLIIGNGEFQSSNYLGSGTFRNLCTMYFKAKDIANTVVLTFYDFYLAPQDSVTIYDGYGNVNFAQRYYGVNPGISYESTGPYVTIMINQTVSSYRGVYGEFHSN